MEKPVSLRVVFTMAVINLILVVISLLLSSRVLANRPRFARTDQPFVMFDNKTARACSATNRFEPIEYAALAKRYGGTEIANPPPASDQRDGPWTKYQTPAPPPGYTLDKPIPPAKPPADEWAKYAVPSDAPVNAPPKSDTNPFVALYGNQTMPEQQSVSARVDEGNHYLPFCSDLK